MESVSPDPVPPVEGVGDRVEVSLLGEGMVEGGIEDRDLWHPWPEGLTDGDDAPEGVRVVEGCEFDPVLAPAGHVAVDQHRAAEVSATVDDTVDHGVDRTAPVARAPTHGA